MADFRPNVKYLPVEDLLSVTVRPGRVARRVAEENHQRITHLNARREILTVKFLEASTGIDLRDLPDDVVSLILAHWAALRVRH